MVDLVVFGLFMIPAALVAFLTTPGLIVIGPLAWLAVYTLLLRAGSTPGTFTVFATARQLDGRNVGAVRAVVRSLTFILLGPLTLVSVPFDRRRRSLDDLVGGTMVFDA